MDFLSKNSLFPSSFLTQLSEVIAALEVIEVKGVNDDTQKMKE